MVGEVGLEEMGLEVQAAKEVLVLGEEADGSTYQTRGILQIMEGQLGQKISSAVLR